jgi:hypothetical protein
VCFFKLDRSLNPATAKRRHLVENEFNTNVVATPGWSYFFEVNEVSSFIQAVRILSAKRKVGFAFYQNKDHKLYAFYRQWNNQH